MIPSNMEDSVLLIENIFSIKNRPIMNVLNPSFLSDTLHVMAEKLKGIIQDLIFWVISHLIRRQESWIAFNFPKVFGLIALNFILSLVKPISNYFLIDSFLEENISQEEHH